MYILPTTPCTHILAIPFYVSVLCITPLRKPKVYYIHTENIFPTLQLVRCCVLLFDINCLSLRGAVASTVDTLRWAWGSNTLEHTINMSENGACASRLALHSILYRVFSNRYHGVALRKQRKRHKVANEDFRSLLYTIRVYPYIHGRWGCRRVTCMQQIPETPYENPSVRQTTRKETSVRMACMWHQLILRSPTFHALAGIPLIKL